MPCQTHMIPHLVFKRPENCGLKTRVGSTSNFFVRHHMIRSAKHGKAISDAIQCSRPPSMSSSRISATTAVACAASSQCHFVLT